MYDAIIVGGGPAGLSAALILGRCRRRVLVCDSGEYRNAASRGLHGFLSRDGVLPGDLLRIGREQLQPYGVELRQTKVLDARKDGDSFEVALEEGDRLRSRTLVLASGVVDRIPKVAGIRGLYGRSVFHCPYCDGWEMRDQPVAAYGRGKRGLKLALALTTWTKDVILVSDGPSRLSEEELDRLARHRVPVEERQLARLEGSDGVLRQIVFRSGDPLPRRAMFFKTGHDQRSDLPARFGCAFTKKGAVKTDKLAGTDVRGLYVVGDAAHDVQLAVIAAAKGVKAAFALNSLLSEEEHA